MIKSMPQPDESHISWPIPAEKLFDMGLSELALLYEEAAQTQAARVRDLDAAIGRLDERHRPELREGLIQYLLAVEWARLIYRACTAAELRDAVTTAN
jgi:hypothetical protein